MAVTPITLTNKHASVTPARFLTPHQLPLGPTARGGFEMTESMGGPRIALQGDTCLFFTRDHSGNLNEKPAQAPNEFGVRAGGSPNGVGNKKRGSPMDLRAMSAAVSQAAKGLAGLTLRLQARFAARDTCQASAFGTDMHLWEITPQQPHRCAFLKEFRYNLNTVQQIGRACQR